MPTIRICDIAEVLIEVDPLRFRLFFLEIFHHHGIHFGEKLLGWITNQIVHNIELICN